MDNKKAIMKLVKLQTLLIRYIERYNNKKFVTAREIESLLSNDKFVFTYEEAINNLILYADEYHCDIIEDELLQLNYIISEGPLKQLNTGVLEGDVKYTELEHQLNSFRLTQTITSLNSCCYTITEATNIIRWKIKDTTMKKACQNGILLNTKKVSSLWLVDIQEVREHWNVAQNIEEIILNQQKIYELYLEQLSNAEFRKCVTGFKSIGSRVKLPKDAVDRDLAIEVLFTNQQKLIVYKNYRGNIDVIQ